MLIRDRLKDIDQLIGPTRGIAPEVMRRSRAVTSPEVAVSRPVPPLDDAPV